MKVYMNGMCCLNCALGWYDGYDITYNFKKTMPCKICGNQQPASMTQKRFRELVKERDERLKDKDASYYINKGPL